MQVQGIVFIQLQGSDILVNCKEINSFKEHVFIHKKYNHSRNLSVHSRKYILVQGKHFLSGTLYPLKDIYLNLRNIYSFKFKAICSFKETIFIEDCCVGGHSRNIYSKIVPSYLMIIINFTITIS